MGHINLHNKECQEETPWNTFFPFFYKPILRSYVYKDSPFYFIIGLLILGLDVCQTIASLDLNQTVIYLPTTNSTYSLDIGNTIFNLEAFDIIM